MFLNINFDMSQAAKKGCKGTKKIIKISDEIKHRN